MVVLGLKYREMITHNSDVLPDVCESSEIEKIAEMIGYDKETNLPVNILRYADDSRFLGAFNRIAKPPTCHDEKLLKPVGCETFAENERFNNFLVSEIEDAQSKIKDANTRIEQRRFEAAKRSIELQQSNSNESNKIE